ncbi:hypothetical protein IW150_007109, partial [Coemansia sp. RSA 2607]
MLASRRFVALAKFLAIIAAFVLLLHVGVEMYASRHNTTGQSIYDKWTNALSREKAYGGGATGENQYSPEGTKPVRAALVALVRNQELYGMRKTIRELED